MPGGTRQRDLGSRGASGGAAGLPPALPHSDVTAATLNVTAVINTWGRCMWPHKERIQCRPRAMPEPAPAQGRMSGTLPQGARVGWQRCLPCK